MLIFPTPKLSPYTGMVGYGGGASSLSTFLGGIPPLVTSGNYDNDMSLGNDDFCIEFFFRKSTTNQKTFWGYGSDSPMGEVDNQKLRYYSNTYNGISGFNLNVGTFSTNTWYHIAFVREDGDGDERMIMYFNGQIKEKITRAGDWDQETLTIGARANGTLNFDGHISNFRFRRGTSVYGFNNSYTVPSLPLAVTSDTILYCCNHPNASDGQFGYSNGGNVALDVGGSPTVSDSEVPSGASYSVSFGTNNYLRTPSS